MGIWEKKFRSKSPNSKSDDPRGRSVTSGGKNQINRTLNYLRKLAVDSAVDDSLKGVAGVVLMDKIAKQGPIDKNNKLGLEVAEVVHAGMEKMQVNANCDEPQTMIFSQSIRLLDCFDDLPKEPIKGSNSSKTAPRRIMIRSRL